MNHLNVPILSQTHFKYFSLQYGVIIYFFLILGRWEHSFLKYARAFSYTFKNFSSRTIKKICSHLPKNKKSIGIMGGYLSGLFGKVMGIHGRMAW